MILKWSNTFVYVNLEHFTFHLQCINILVHFNLIWTFLFVDPYFIMYKNFQVMKMC